MPQSIHIKLEKIQSTLDKHSKILDQHSKILELHTKILDQHSKTLGQHSKILDKHSKILDHHSKQLGAQAVLLLKLEQKIDVIDERTRSYPKLYDNVDKLVQEIVENRQGRVFTLSQLQNHNGRLLALENS